MESINLQEKYHGKKIDTANILSIEKAEEISKGKKCVVITGVTGQDGSLMSDFLLKNTDYVIFGGVRRLSVYNHSNIAHINSDRFHLVNFDLTDNYSISRIIEKLKPDYFFNFAAQSFVGSSWDFPQQTWVTNTNSVIYILESIRLYHPSCRFYQAGSSEEFGDVSYVPQDSNHPLRPRSPYGASKAASRQIVKVWRDSYGLYAVQGWLFNHEGTRRGEEFVTRKISKGVARIKNAIDKSLDIDPIELGNLDAKRDWSDSRDFVEGVWMMMNQKAPKDYILASGETHTVREFVEKAFSAAGISGLWVGSGFNESFVFEGQTLAKINPQFFRPAEVDILLGDSTPIREELGWKPKISFDELVRSMVEFDLNECEN